VVPGWALSTSLSRSTSGGVHRVASSRTCTGPRGASLVSSSVTSEPISLTVSSRASVRPLIATTASSAMLSATCA
jgi:hypothetical protein